MPRSALRSSIVGQFFHHLRQVAGFLAGADQRAIDLGKVARPGGQRRRQLVAGAHVVARTPSSTVAMCFFSAWSSVALRGRVQRQARGQQAGQLARQPGQVGVGQARAQRAAQAPRRAAGRWTAAAGRGRAAGCGRRARCRPRPCRARFFRARQSLRNERMACSWFRSRCEESPGEPHFQRVSRPPPCPWNMTVVLQCHPVYSDANSRFHTISRLRHTYDMRQFAQLSLAVLLAASQIRPAASPAYAQQADNRQPEFRGYRHSRRAARAVALHAAQLPGGPARQGQAHAGLGPSGGQQPGPVHADRRGAPAGLRHCRCGRRDPRGARSRRQAAGQRGGGRSRPAAKGAPGRCPASRAAREAAARC